MGKASRRRREVRQSLAGRAGGKGGSKLYREIPRPVIATCEEVLSAYTSGRAPAGDPALLDDWPAMIYAEAAALEAVDILTARRGHSADLLFADLLEEPAFAPLTPAMLPLLHFLRARRAGHDPTLRLDPHSPQLALPLLLLAGQALVSAADERPGASAVDAGLRECLRRLADTPLDERTPAGDLAFGLTEQQREQVSDEEFVRDEARKILTGTVPVSRAVAAVSRPVLLVLDLAARPDVEDLLRILHTDAPADGADTVTWWRAFAGTDTTVVRLEVQWLEPVRTSVAVVLEADEHRPLLETIAADGRVDLTATDPADSPDSPFSLARVTTDGASLSGVLRQAASRRE